LYVWGRKKRIQRFVVETLKEKDYLKNLDSDGEIMGKCNLKAEYGMRRIGFTKFGIVKRGRLL
jgi:alanine racemase